MEKSDVLTIFKDKIRDNQLVLPDGSLVDVEFFATIFSGANASTTYEEFVAIDAGVMGYKHFFDQCRKESIFN